MKLKIAASLIICACLIIACDPPTDPIPPTISCSSPSGNMICFDGNAYIMWMPATNLSGTYATSCGGYHILTLQFTHSNQMASPNNATIAGVLNATVKGYTSPQVGTFTFKNPPSAVCSLPLGAKEFYLSPGVQVTFGTNTTMYTTDSLLTNSLTISNVNGNLVSGYYNGQVRNMSISSDIKSLHVYFEDLAL